MRYVSCLLESNSFNLISGSFTSYVNKILLNFRVGDEIAIPIDFGGGNRLAPVGKVADKTGQLVNLNVQVVKRIFLD